MTIVTGDNIFGISDWIVDPTLGKGTHTTVQGAIDDASSGDSIFIRPGTYTENLTLIAGINLVGASFSEVNSNVNIVGQIAQSATGTSTVSNITFNSNGSVIVNITGSGSIQTRFRFCKFFMDDADAISINNSSASPFFHLCSFRQTANSLDIFNITSVDTVTFERCEGTSTVATAGTSDIASGTVRFRYSNFSRHQFTSSTSGLINSIYSKFGGNADNLTQITTAGTGSDHFFNGCIFESGSSAAISIGSGTSADINNCVVRSSNSNPVGGAGTIVYSNLVMRGTGSGVNPTTETGRITQLAKWRAQKQAAFLARPNGTKSNKTGNGTVYTIVFDSEIFDQASDYDGTSTFTAPVNGKYQFNVSCHLSGVTSSGTFANLTLITSKRSYILAKMGSIGGNIDSGTIIFNGSIIADMDASQTATVTIQTGGESSDIVDIVGTGTHGTFFSGMLLA